MANAKDCSGHANRNSIVRLQSSDGQIIEVEEAVASISWIINAIIEDVGTDAVIPLPSVSAANLKIVMEYCTFHALHDPEYRPQISKEEEEEYWRRIRDEEEQQKSLAAVSWWGDEEQKSVAAVSGWDEEQQKSGAVVGGWDDEEQNRMAAVSGWDDDERNRMASVSRWDDEEPNRMAAVDDEEQNRMVAAVSGWDDEERNRMAVVSGWDQEEQKRTAGRSGWGSEEEDDENGRRMREEEEKRRAVEQKRRADMWEWDDEFVKKMDMGTLCEVVEASDYLNVLKLRDLVARCCGEKIMKKTMELFHTSRRRKSWG